ncbi:MAG: 7-carboxy-7-deazaguanine synthase QueE [Planctomycetota bacterium]
MPELPLLDIDAPPVLVSETFVSLQGEGVLTGVPSWFCRLSGCNLRCRWCDTPYASWAPEGDKRTVHSLVDEAVRTGVHHAVLTGGEPMIFPQLAPLTHALAGAGVHITIETAGTVDRDDIAFDLMSLSPKLSNSTPTGDPRDPTGAWAGRHDERRIDLDALQALVDRSAGAHGKARQLKFVVTSPADLAEIDHLLAKLKDVHPGEVILMPEGTQTPDPDNVKWVVDLCLERGWRYGHRLHIELFGDTRGT